MSVGCKCTPQAHTKELKGENNMRLLELIKNAESAYKKRNEYQTRYYLNQKFNQEKIVRGLKARDEEVIIAKGKLTNEMFGKHEIESDNSFQKAIELSRLSYKTNVKQIPPPRIEKRIIRTEKRIDVFGRTKTYKTIAVMPDGSERSNPVGNTAKRKVIPVPKNSGEVPNKALRSRRTSNKIVSSNEKPYTAIKVYTPDANVGMKTIYSKSYKDKRLCYWIEVKGNLYPSNKDFKPGELAPNKLHYDALRKSEVPTIITNWLKTFEGNSRIPMGLETFEVDGRTYFVRVEHKHSKGKI